MTPYQLHVRKWRDGCSSDICARAKKVCLGRGQLPSDILFVGEAPGVSEDILGVPFVGVAGKELDRWVRKAGIRSKESVCKELGAAADIPLYILRDLALERGTRFLTVSFTNLTGCIPLDKEGDKMEGGPDEEDIKCCSTRLQEWVWLAQPKLIVCVGKLATEYLEQGYRHSVKLPTVCPVCTKLQYKNQSGLSCENGHGFGWEEPGDPIPQVSIDHPAYVLRQNSAQKGLLAQRAVVRIKQALNKLFEHRESNRARD